jgi:hypothetical protein
MGTGRDGRKLLIISGVSAVLESGESLIFYARPGGLELRLEPAFAAQVTRDPEFLSLAARNFQPKQIEGVEGTP